MPFTSDTDTYPLRTLIKYWLIAISVLLTIGFVVFQGRFLITGPRIVFQDLPQGPQNNRQVTITGDAYNISRLWLNDRPIYTDAKGRFEEAIVLENGYTIATLRAEDRYGRTTKVSTPLVFVPASLR
jgi:hypothetical protein